MILIIAVTVFAILISYFTYQENQRTSLETVRLSANRMENILVEHEKTLDQAVTNLTSSQTIINNLYQYFDLDIADYLQKSLSAQKENEPFIYLPKLITEMYYMDSDIDSIGVALDNYKQVYYSDRKNKAGKKFKQYPREDNKVIFTKPLIDSNSLRQIGTLSMTFNNKELQKVVDNYGDHSSLQVFVISSTKKQIYHDQKASDKATLQRQIQDDLIEDSHLNLSQLKKDYYVKSVQTKNDFQILSLISKRDVLVKSIKRLLLFLLASMVLDAILLFTLRKTFKRYTVQVEDIQKVTSQVSVGNKDLRINEKTKQGELKEISISINQMLDGINRYIKDIYELEIKQKDAHMRALQSQINPHFLYNTLEYIRMYAVSEGADELSNVVYVFASLLRNNISHEKTVSIRHELEFCEKYAYLYQMRYRDRIAYSFKISGDLGERSIPKFTLQPLVENFFVHGIDHTRIDNVISVKVFEEDNLNHIIIQDNGTGIEEEKLAQINQLLAGSSEETVLGDSIGIQNVNERLRAFFGEDYAMSFRNNDLGGLTIEIIFGEEE